MELGYLAMLVAEIPQWLTFIVRDGLVDFETYKQFELSTQKALSDHFEDCFNTAIETFESAKASDFDGSFTLQRGQQKLMSSSKIEAISSNTNHWIHHRGQLTVYMRMNEIPVPSIYGPSADDKTF